MHKASNHAHSGSAVRQASTTSVVSTKEARLRKHTQERSDMRPIGDKANRGDRNASNISCASGKALHSCEVISMEISEASNDENQQVDDEHSVRTINNDCVANRLLTGINESNLQMPLEQLGPPPGAAEQLNPTKDSNCLSSGNVEIEYPKGCCVTPVLAMENQNEPSTLLDRADSSSLSETTLKQDVLLEASDAVVELSDAVQNCVKHNPRRRRQLILLDDDDDEEAADVQSENFNHRSLQYDGSLSKHRIDTEDCVEETVHTENLNGHNPSAVKLDSLIPESSEITRPVKKQRRYTEVNEDDEDGVVIVGTSSVECALNNFLKLTSETLVAKDHVLQSSIEFDSESADQQRSMYSQPIDEPIWRYAYYLSPRQVYILLCEILMSPHSSVYVPTVESLK